MRSPQPPMRRLLALFTVLALAGCDVPNSNPAVRPEPGDHYFRIEVEAVQILNAGVVTIPAEIDVTVDAVNGQGEPLDADDHKKLKNWKSGRSTTIPGKPWQMTLSQSPGPGGGIIVASFVIVAVADDAVNINCRFFTGTVGGPEYQDKPKFQTGKGSKTVCLYSIQFPGG